MSDDLPPLEDFQDQIKQIQYNKPKNYGSEDIYKPDPKYLDESDQKNEIDSLNKKVESIQIDLEKKKQAVTKSKGEGYGGMKKGFLSGGLSSKPKEQKITEVKVEKKSNPLEIKEVQQAMKMNNYLQDTRSQWMTQNFLQKVTSNSKVSVLFSNPEYMKAIDLFKTNPREAMLKYGNNKQFMEAFQQFCKLMGMQFQNLAGKPK